MKRFVEGVDRGQSTLFPECLDDWIDEDNPVRVIDVFVDELDLGTLEFGGVDAKATGRPSYHPSILLKLYVYGYLNRVQSSRRLEYAGFLQSEPQTLSAARHLATRRFRTAWVDLRRWCGVEGGRSSRRAANGFTGWKAELWGSAKRHATHIRALSVARGVR